MGSTWAIIGASKHPPIPPVPPNHLPSSCPGSKGPTLSTRGPAGQFDFEESSCRKLSSPVPPLPLPTARSCPRAAYPAVRTGHPAHITGVGAVTGYGWGSKHIWDGFLLGESAVKLTDGLRRLRRGGDGLPRPDHRRRRPARRAQPVHAGRPVRRPRGHHRCHGAGMEAGAGGRAWSTASSRRHRDVERVLPSAECRSDPAVGQHAALHGHLQAHEGARLPRTDHVGVGHVRRPATPA